MIMVDTDLQMVKYCIFWKELAIQSRPKVRQTQNPNYPKYLHIYEYGSSTCPYRCCYTEAQCWGTPLPWVSQSSDQLRLHHFFYPIHFTSILQPLLMSTFQEVSRVERIQGWLQGSPERPQGTVVTVFPFCYLALTFHGDPVGEPFLFPKYYGLTMASIDFITIRWHCGLPRYQLDSSDLTFWFLVSQPYFDYDSDKQVPLPATSNILHFHSSSSTVFSIFNSQIAIYAYCPSPHYTTSLNTIPSSSRPRPSTTSPSTNVLSTRFSPDKWYRLLVIPTTAPYSISNTVSKSKQAKFLSAAAPIIHALSYLVHWQTYSRPVSFLL